MFQILWLKNANCIISFRISSCNYSIICICSSKSIWISLTKLNFYLNRDGNEMEFEINSRVVTVEIGRDGHTFTPSQGVFHIDLDFEHTTMDYDTQNWSILCGVTYIATSDQAWDLGSCLSRTSGTNLTRCSCSRPGTYAALLTRKSSRVR